MTGQSKYGVGGKMERVGEGEKGEGQGAGGMCKGEWGKGGNQSLQKY